MAETAITTQRLRKLLLRLPQECIGLDLSGVTRTRYVRVILRHLWSLVRSPNSLANHRKRAQVMVLTLALSTAMATSGVVYGIYALISRFRANHSTRTVSYTHLKRSSLNNLRHERCLVGILSFECKPFRIQDAKGFVPYQSQGRGLH